MAAAVAELLTVADAFSRLTLAVCTLALCALFLRRRCPLVALCATLPSILTGHLWLPPMIAMFHVAKGPSRALRVVGCGLLFCAAVCPWPVGELATMTREEILTSIEAAGLLSTGPTALGLLAATRAELRARLADLTATQKRERRLEAERAVARERARLAREMHDTVSHHVGIIAVQSGALRAAGTADDWQRESAESIRRHSVQALEELRDMVGVLRGSDAEAAATAGRAGLDDLRGLAADSLLDVDLTLDLPGGAWPEAVEAAVFRIVQEALNNVRKHAPGTRVTVRVAPAEDAAALTVEVRNSRPSCRRATGLPTGGGHGLVGLRERAELLGGRLTARPSADGGFLVRAELPL
ncbi:two-component sensor histidine kinase [Streptomyces sp. MUM 203J]|uniref:sensor histidine kinase n=1 Tax=Streptomyces sp. MUM 203J TaxID=2791990 RepID=UPI001F040C50|nr:histidine kinase [Streptomyces sp. MUM 203J]MCH0538224.1 two-component sensor histidine kinase [Streptomyces sp. MUM 203J]